MSDALKKDREAVSERLHAINKSWLDARLDDLEGYLHEEVVMVMPGFTARTRGKEHMMDGFRDFCTNCRVQRFESRDLTVDVVGDSAVCTFAFYLVYDRDGSQYRSTGYDVWVLSRQDSEWLAVWRTMQDVSDTRIGKAQIPISAAARVE